jgi:hypothetical protein
MIRDDSGNILVAGVRGGDYMILKFAPDTGELIWPALYDGPGNGYDTANSVMEGPAGEVIVTGFTTGVGTGWDATTIALDPLDATLLWDDSFDAGDARTEEGSAIAASSAYDVYVVGYGYGLQTDQDLLSLRYHLQQTTAPVAPNVAGRYLAASPNPTSSGTTFSFALRAGSEANLTIHDLTGRRIATLLDGFHGTNVRRLDWGGRDANGRAVPAGVYVARLEDGRTRICMKIVLTR